MAPRCAVVSALLLPLLAAAGQVDPRYAKEITVYHVHAANVSNIPMDMDTGDAPGDLFFELDQFLLPLQCADPSYFYDKFECQNPEHLSKGLVATEVHLEVDSRYTNYSGCNFCTGTDPFTRKPCEAGTYVCDCMNFLNPKGCDRRFVGMETVVHEFVHDVTEECKDTLEEVCGHVRYSKWCNLCLARHQHILNKSTCSADAKSYCPGIGFPLCTSDSKNYDCWHMNLGRKTKGLWFSTFREGYCDDESPDAFCSWKDMYRFDLCTKQWEYLITSGDCPCGRYRHQAMVKDDLMYIVGGSGINRYGDVWTFHFGTNVWRRVNCSGTDLSDGRYAHSAVLREGFIYLYGGNDTVRHDDLLQLDLETKIWSRVLVHGKDCPPGRDFHAAVLRKDSMVVFGGSNGMRRHNDVFEFHMAPKIPPCSLSSDLEATFEAAQTQDVIQRSCNIFLAANDSDWVHGVFCHEHLIQVRCPHLYRLVQDRVNGAASGSDTAEQDDNLDSLLRAVKDDNVKAPRHAPPGWMASECSSHCHWIPVDLPHIILHHFLLFLYSDSTRFGHLSMDQLYRLFLTARQWEVPRLAALCERQIKIRLSIDSVLPLLRVSAAEPRAESIQDACKQFFLANYQACTNLQECEALDPRLLCELMRLNTAKAASPVAAAPGPPMAPSAASPSSPQVIHSSGSAPQLATSPGARSKAGQSPQAWCEDLQESSWHATSLDHAQALPASTLAQDLKRLLTEEIAPDFEVVVQDEVILVHKFLMVARSKYFETCILTSGMQESQEGRLVIDASWAMTAEEFRALLHFLYAGDEILRILAPHTAMYLVDASSFYGLTNHRLKHFCELCIKDSFNETHVLQLFEASSRLDVEGTQAVRSMALDFIISNFHTVCQQPALEQLDRSLLIEIMRGVADRLHPSPPQVQTVQLT